jgi:hypothetical protein
MNCNKASPALLPWLVATHLAALARIPATLLLPPPLLCSAAATNTTTTTAAAAA